MHTPGLKQEKYEEELLLALDEGLVSQEEMGALREEALRLHRSPLELLKEQGVLSEDTLARLHENGPRADTDRGPRQEEADTLGHVTPNTLKDTGTPAFPVPDWERYQPVRFLGQGGMGQVFLAYDPLLRRNVALKFVLDGDPELARRFLSEARAQARVRHERVCEVYEVGEVRGRGFIAMRYVDGLPLGQLAPTLPMEQRVRVLRQAAEGVHAAHRAGLIHRDIKPANILVERTEDGGFAPFVMDFGLARDWREQGGAAHLVLGTPHYMAPEQARGDATPMDRRVDVYALGSTLYALLTGRPPFQGTDEKDVIARLQTEEPRPPRSLDEDIPADLEAIVLKCLEKKRSDRYDSVRALSDDLERFLEGEPVLARPGLGYRLRKKARKHRKALAVGAATLGVVTLALGQAVVARSEVAERERLSRRFTERVERIESAARYSALSRLHDTRADRQALRDAMAALEEEVRQGGSRAAGSGQYALGRALLALDDLEGARTRLEAAWNQGDHEPRVAWALALALGGLYRDQLLLDVERRPPEQREARRQELARKYRDPALDYLRQAEGPDVPAPPLYVRALFSFYEDRYEEALAHLTSMGATHPWFYEAPLLQGDVLLARATQRWNQGDKNGSQADLEAGRRAYAVATAVAESQPAVHHALARLELAALIMELYGAGDVLPHYERGLEALSRALTVAPDHDASLMLSARFHRRLAEYRSNRSLDGVEPLLEKAIAASTAALALAPSNDRTAMDQALTWRLWARHRQQAGLDPREQLRLGIASFERLRPESRDYPYFASLGLMWQVWADYEAEHGGEPLGYQDKAIAAHREAIRLRETQPDAWINLGGALRKRAALPNAPEPEADLLRARDALAKALELNPSNVVACFQAADTSDRLGRRRRDQGGDPWPDQQRALELYRQGLAINPKLPQLHNGLGATLLWQAEQRWDEGGETTSLLDAARKSFEQARDVAPQQPFAYNNLGEEALLRARIQLDHHEDPGPSARAAAESFRHAIDLLPGDADIWTSLALTHVARAGWALERRENPRPELDAAEAALKKARELNPRFGGAWRVLGETLGVRARWQAQRGAARDEDFAEADTAFQQALTLEPRKAEHLLASARHQLAWGEWKRSAGADAVSTLKQALALAERARAERPTWARARVLRANVLRALAPPDAESTVPAPEAPPREHVAGASEP